MERLRLDNENGGSLKFIDIVGVIKTKSEKNETPTYRNRSVGKILGKWRFLDNMNAVNPKHYNKIKNKPR